MSIVARLAYIAALTGSLALAGAVGCIPEPTPDAGSDAADAGPADEDAGPLPQEEDAGPLLDAGGETSCPAINPLAPNQSIGQACAVECQECGAEGCIAPGTGCVFIRCEPNDAGALAWVRLTSENPDSVCEQVADGGTVDAGSADAGTGDAGTADAGAADAGAADAGSDDAGSDDAGAAADAGATDAGSADGG